MGNTLGYATQLGSTVTALDQYRRYADVQQYSLDIEQQLPAGFAAKIGYVGSHGKNLQASTTGTTGENVNQLPDQYLTQYTAAQLGLISGTAGATCASLGAAAPVQCASAAPTASLNQVLRPFQGFSSVTLLGSPARSNYNSFIFRLEKATSHGISFLASFTASSTWDSVFGTGSTIDAGITAAQDANNLKAEYARSITDIPLRFSMGASYDLPFGKGKAFLNSNRYVGYVVGGWSVNTIGVKQSGEPLSPSQNSNAISGIGASVQHPDYSTNSAVVGLTGRTEKRIGATGLPKYFNTGAFTAPGSATDINPAIRGSAFANYGSVPRTISALGPGLDSWDVSIFKTQKFERFDLQFRAEALNISNTPQFGAPNVKIGNASAGVVSSQVNLPRLIQLGGRFDF